MFQSSSSVGARCGVCAALMLAFASGRAEAKPWKGEEMITHDTFRYGAFEARILAARGGGVITPFFLWKDGSEKPGAEWQEQDFEIFGRDGTFQTQLMTPGQDGTNRTEHVVLHSLPTKAWEHYYTYRMEWTPTRLAFYIDGRLIREETDQTEYAKLMSPSRAEAAQLRVSIWAGDYAWSGAFDSSAMPAAVFVNWVQTYSYTPGAGPQKSDFTPLWRDDFNNDSGRWWGANWTFDEAINDYVTQNATRKNGYLVLVLTSESTTGRFPDPPIDDGSIAQPPPPPPPPPPPAVVSLPGRVEAEAYSEYYDTTPGNSGDAVCSSTDVDAELTSDPNGGNCDVGYTVAGEWLGYAVQSAEGGKFDLTARVAANVAGKQFHIAIDGTDVTRPLDVPAQGWQAFNDVTVPGIAIAPGQHSVRLLFDSDEINVNYLDFTTSGSVSTPPPPPPPPTCSPSTKTYEAESMSHSTGGSATGGWNIWSNGNISTTHNFLGGDSILRVRAYGQVAANVWPHMVVKVGNQTIGDKTVNATSYTPYEFFYHASAGAQQISVNFDNDYNQHGQDRNLIVDSVAVDECLAQ